MPEHVFSCGGGVQSTACLVLAAQGRIPYKTTDQWITLRRERPELFSQAVELENVLNRKRQEIGKDSVFISSRCRPLADAIPEQLGLFPDWLEEQDGCESGYCMT